MAYIKHRDPLYGVEWSLPEVISRLLETKLCVRYRNITQSASPASMIAMGALPSRCLHGLGVAYLAELVLEKNSKLLPIDFRKHFMTAAFLHDAGNPPFSHLSEPFLKEITGYDGESFLGVLLNEPFFEAGGVLRQFDLDSDLIVKSVTGNYKPYSDVLNGSLDVDNLDNVFRHAFHTGLVSNKDAGTLATSLTRDFNFDGNEWVLPSWREESVRKWQNRRRDVYQQVYMLPHSSLNRMLYRALELTFEEGLLFESFFLLDDFSATEKLAGYKRIGTLVDRARRWQFYSEIFSATRDSNLWIETYSSCRGRMELTEKIRSRFSLEPEDLTVCIFKNNAVRSVTIPYLDSRGFKSVGGASNVNPYQVAVYVHDGILDRKAQIVDALRTELNI